MDGSNATAPLSAQGVDFSNETQALDFLGEILDDTVFQVTSNAYARYFWYGTASLIFVAALHNFATRGIHYSRLRAAASKRPRPARPSNIFSLLLANINNTVRKVSYVQVTPLRTAFWFKLPPLGTTILLLGYFGFIFLLEFIHNSVPGPQHYQSLGLRAAWLAVAQIPLVILLAGKNNLIGALTGQSYERLNILHRWVSRGLLLLATLHFGFLNYGWNEYGLLQLEWKTDACPPTGIAAYAFLLWINLSTFAPIRHWRYEFFVVQHLITFFGFIIALMYHLPDTAYYSRTYVFIAIALYLIDRLVRSFRGVYRNYRPAGALLLASADDADVTKVVVRVKHLTSWSPGSFVLLSIPRFGIFQSHPATIVSTPTSHNGDLVFLLRKHKGFTRRIQQRAIASTATFLSPESPLEKELPNPDTSSSTLSLANADHPSYIAFIDGPYGASQADFAAFDTAVLIAGGTGISFCLSILLDLSHRATQSTLPLRTIRLVWAVKTRKSAASVTPELQRAVTLLRDAGVVAHIDIYLTCDDTIADTAVEDAVAGVSPCTCDESVGPCCCAVSPAPNDVEPRFGYVTDYATSDGISSSSSENVVTQAGPPYIPGAADIDVEKKAAAIQVRSTDLTSRAPNQYISDSAGRPDLAAVLANDIAGAQGEVGVAVCGPLGLTVAARMAVSRVRGGAIYLHVESFDW